MNVKKLAAIAVVLLLVGFSLPKLRAFADEPPMVTSPDGNLKVTLSVIENPPPYAAGERAYYKVIYKDKLILNDSPLGLTFAGTNPLDEDFEVTGSSIHEHNAPWKNSLGATRNVPDRCNQLTVTLRERQEPKRSLIVVFRAYNEGVAFHYRIPKQEGLDRFTLASEDTGFYFAGDASAFALNMKRFNTHNEGEYLRTPLNQIKPESIINLPLLVEMPGGPWVALLEADLTDYAGMYVGGVKGVPNALRTKLSPTPGRKPEEVVIGTTPRTTPWRVLLIGPTAGCLIEHNYLLMNLNPPCAIADASWIQPGKAAWDWWSGSFAKDVDFKPGMNTATMKHYIDFAAASKLEYMLVDAGWCPSGKEDRSENVLNFRPEVNIPEIIAYGKQKGVKTLLWVDWLPLSKKMDEAFTLYEKWGAAGVKIDYMNRDDQEMVNFYDRCVRNGGKTSADGRFPRGIQGYRPATHLSESAHSRGRDGHGVCQMVRPRHARVRRDNPLHADAGRPDGLYSRGIRQRRKGPVQGEGRQTDVARHAMPPTGHVRRLRKPAGHGLRLSRSLQKPAGIRVHPETCRPFGTKRKS